MRAAGTETRTQQTGQAGMAWIEDGTGTIVRGAVESATAEGVRVRLPQTPAFRAGDEVALRICLEPGQPTFGTTGRIAWLREGKSAVECGLEWRAGQDERAALDAWLASAA